MFAITGNSSLQETTDIRHDETLDIPDISINHDLKE